MLKELGSTAYRPQTNGKIGGSGEPYLLEGTTFESVSELKDELQQYYNTLRPHQAMDGKTPLETLKSI